MVKTDPLSAFVYRGHPAPYDTRNFDQTTPFPTRHARVVAVRCKTGLARSRLRGRYVHFVTAMAGVFENGRLRLGARFLCRPHGSPDAIVVAGTTDSGALTCPLCIARLGGAVVYRLFDASGELLYIGATVDFHRRMSLHKSKTGWWPAVHETTIRRFVDLPAAYEAEETAIRLERPRYNTTFNRGVEGGEAA